MVRFRRAASFVPVLVALWAGLDLFVRRDLPGAAWLQHRAFRLLVVPMEWVTEGDGERLVWVLALGSVLVASALLNRAQRWARLVLVLLALIGTLLGLTTISLAVLMERALAAGSSLALFLYVQNLDGDLQRSAGSNRVTGALILGTAFMTSYYIYALFMTRGEGYPLLQFLGEGIRDTGGSWLSLWSFVVFVVGVAAALLCPPSWLRFALCVAPGIALGSLSSPLAAAVLIPTVVLLGQFLLPRLHAVRGGLAWPARIVFPSLVAGLLFGHTYSARVLACPPDDHPRLQRLAKPGEVFRIALGGEGHLALSLRENQRFGALDPEEQSEQARGKARSTV